MDVLSVCSAQHHCMWPTHTSTTLLCFLYLRWLKRTHSVENTFAITPVFSQLSCPRKQTQKEPKEVQSKEDGITTLEDSVASPQKVRHRGAIWPSSSSLRCIPRRISSTLGPQEYLYANVHDSVLHISQTCPSSDEWISEMRYIQTVNFDSAIKRNEILTHAATWMSLEDIQANP